MRSGEARARRQGVVAWRPRALFDLRVERVRAALAGEASAPADASLRELAARDAPDATLARRFSLSPEVVDFLWTCTALEADPRLWPRARELGGGEVRRGATPALHVALFGLDGEAARRLTAELSPERPVARARLAVAAQECLVPAATPFRVPPRVRDFLLGIDAVDPLLARAGGPLAPADGAADPRLVRGLECEEDLLLLVEGARGVGRRAAVGRAAAAAGRDVVEVDLERWDHHVPLDALLGAWTRECALRDAIALVSNVDAPPDPADRRRLRAQLDELPGPIVATARAGANDLRLHRPLLRVPLALPEPLAARRLWREVLPDGDAEMLARRYRLGEGDMRRAVQAARLLPATTGGALDVVGGVRSSIAQWVGDLATRVVVTQAWEDLVLPPDTLDQVRALVARVRHAHRVLDDWGFGRKLARAQGVAALLSGPPGTGKTMVAGLIARELELDLYQVDLSRVLSKWVGETEKQLAALFDAAEAGHALLLFDEADSLFGKRTEVKGASDHYANLEVNYLLQRVEAFAGIALLTTNMETAIDPAVRRRLAAHIVFWPPEEDERLELWRRMVPPEAPVAGELDLRALAREFSAFSGAHIRNAAVAAAFLAAAEDSALTQGHLERAARAEHSAMGRVLHENKEGPR